MRRNLVLVAVLAVTIAGLLGTASRPAAEARQSTPSSGASLIGAWQLAISLTEESPNAALPANQTSLITLFADGNVILANAGQLPLLPPSSGLFFTAAHGSWEASGPDSADLTFMFLVIDQAGGLSSVNTGTMSITIDPSGDRFTGSLAIGAVSTSGNPTGAQEGTVEGTRIKAAPVDGTPAA